MSFAVQHVHLKTRDPNQTAQFYIDNFGATLKGEIPGRGVRVDLHELRSRERERVQVLSGVCRSCCGCARCA